MQPVSLDSLVANAKLYADMRAGQNDSFLSTAEWEQLANQQCREHYEMCIMARPDFYAIEQESAVNMLNALVKGKRTFIPLPTCPPYFMLLGIEVVWGTGDVEVIPEIRAADSGFYERLTWSRYNTKGYVLGGGPRPKDGEGIYLVPGPAVDGTILRIRYIPAFQTLGIPDCAGESNENFNAVDGWDKLVSLGMAREALSIQDKSTGNIDPLYMECKEHILSMSRERNAQEKRRVRDVDVDASLYGWDGGYIVGPR